MLAMQPCITRGLVNTALGQVHYVDHRPPSASSTAVSNVLLPLICLHMSPRSTDEYLEAGQLLAAKGRRVIAIDEPGYGFSDNPSQSCTLHDIADGVVKVADELGVDKFHVAGSLMGALTGLSVASRYPSRAKAYVATHLYFWPEDQVAKAKEEAAKGTGEVKTAVDKTDTWVIEKDGSHLTKLWNSRAPFLPEELNQRAVMDEQLYLMKRKERYARGVSIEQGQLFDFEGTVRGVKGPALHMVGTQCRDFFDRIGYKGTEQFDKTALALPQDGLERHLIEGGAINMINTHAEQWSDIVAEFLANAD